MKHIISKHHLYFNIINNPMVQLKDNLIHACILLVENSQVNKDHIMHLIFEPAPVTFMPASGKSSALCTREHYTHLNELFKETYNINSIYMMNLQILSLYVPINP